MSRTMTLGESVAAYIGLAKPRIIELLLITTVPSMILAAGKWPGTWLVAATLVGGTLSAGGANAVNSYLERDRDRLMDRTAARPLPTGRVTARGALLFGAGLGVGGAVWLAVVVNPAAAALATGGLLFYVFVYTITLKPRTAQNIVIGGAAGAAPTLVGWAAVTGGLELPAWILFAIVFYWTPPHFWALALRFKDDYAAAGIPMLPVVAGEAETVRQIVRFTLLLVAATLLLFPSAHLGVFYLLAALLLGALLSAAAVRLKSRPESALEFFHLTNLYLTLLFAAMAIDVLRA
ncbi:MAG: heme o synthase [Acidimicrobiia bacterium]